MFLIQFIGKIIHLFAVFYFYSIVNKKGMNIFQAEHEEKLRKLISDLSVSLEASSSPTPSVRGDQDPARHNTDDR